MIFWKLGIFKQALENEHTEAIGLVKEMEYSDCGSVKVVGPAIKFSDYEIKLQPAPFLGQHTDEVLNTLLNLSTAEIANLRKLKVIS